MKVIAYLHTHWDREWYQPFEEFRLRFVEVFGKVLTELEQNKIQQFYLDGQTVALEDYLELFPERKDEISQLIQNKRLNIGPWYALADEFLVSGESLIRNLLTGIKQAKSFDCEDFIGYLPDAFGHCEAMPMIFKSFDFETALLWRGAGDKKSTFLWKSKDGAAIKTIHLSQGYFQDILTMDADYSKKAKALKSILDKIADVTDEDVLFIPIGADHLATPDELDLQISETNKLLKKYEIQQGSLVDYAKTLKSKDLKTYCGELRDNSKSDILSSVFSTRMYLKQANAHSQWLLTKLCEPLQAFCETSNISTSRKNQLDYAWKTLLKNHAHDSICGCSVDPVHQEMMTRYQKVDQVSNGVIDRCLRDISKHVDEKSIAIFNASNFAYSGLVKVITDKKLPQNLQKQLISEQRAFAKELLYDIQKIPVTEDYLPKKEYLVRVESLQPNSITILDKTYKTATAAKTLEITDEEIKNENIQVKVNQDGFLTITNLQTGVVISGGHVFEDIADYGDSYNFAPIKNDKPVKAKFKGSKVIEKGPLRSILRLTYSMMIPANSAKQKRSKTLINHILTTDIILEESADIVEFKTEWNNKSQNHLLQVAFKLKEKISKLTCEDHFGLIERDFDPDYKMVEFTPAPKKTELKTNTAPVQRFVWAQGVGLLTDGLSECEIESNKLKLTLLRSTGIISNPFNASRGTPAGPPLPVPDAQCLGKQTARYAISLCESPIELFHKADKFMGCTLTTTGVAQSSEKSTHLPYNFLNINNENIYIYAIKVCETTSNALVVRLFNLTNEAQKINIGSQLNFSEIFETNSFEQPINMVNYANKQISFSPNELKTFLLKL